MLAANHFGATFLSESDDCQASKASIWLLFRNLVPRLHLVGVARHPCDHRPSFGAAAAGIAERQGAGVEHRLCLEFPAVDGGLALVCR